MKVMSDDDRTFDPVQTLTDHAEHLNAMYLFSASNSIELIH